MVTPKTRLAFVGPTARLVARKSAELGRDGKGSRSYPLDMEMEVDTQLLVGDRMGHDRSLFGGDWPGTAGVHSVGAPTAPRLRAST